MRRIKVLSCLTSLLILLNSCQEVIDIKLKPGDLKVVIEGLVTNQPEPFVVKISRSEPFTEGNTFTKFENASVTIRDDAGNVYVLSHVGDGVYKTTTPVQGVVGRTYYLTAIVDGVTYTAEDRLYSVPPIDTMYYAYFTPDATHFQEGYYVYASTSDPPNEKNYYLYKFFRNSDIVGNANTIYVNDDRFLSSQIRGVEIPGVFKEQDVVTMEQYSLSEKAFNFYNGLSLQMLSDGGFFTTPPANAPTNLSNGALGFFQASSVSRYTVTILP
ncbi:MAG: DUF4249 domain-containing protein [Cytophagaceae bacterium]|nr:DUF4249 domain-containing protein [Cytophagaceae bacterium]MDW8457359.1 DUF4249 domain-containing protein [Cytophagaceae bacterium]